MGPANLALIFTSVVFGDDDVVSLESYDRNKVRNSPFSVRYSSSSSARTQDYVMETLIREQHTLFRDTPADPSVRSRSNSAAVQSPRPRGLLLSPSQLARAMEEASESDTSSASRQQLSPGQFSAVRLRSADN